MFKKILRVCVNNRDILGPSLEHSGIFCYTTVENRVLFETINEM